jgi:hypothetical protein
MTSDLLLIFMTFVHRRKTAAPKVCPKSFATNTKGAFRCCCHSMLPLSSPQLALFLAFHIRSTSLKPHSNRMSLPHTASFM